MEMVWLNFSVFLATLVVVFGILRWVNHWYYVWKFGRNSLPPGDMGWPLIGNMLPFFKAFNSNDPDAFVNNLVRRYGRTGIYKTHLFGSPSIIVCLPEACKRILSDDQSFPVGYPVSTRELMGKTAFHNESVVERKRVRKLITSPIIGHEALALYLGYIEELMVDALDEWSSMAVPIEFLTEMRTVAFKIISHIFFGYGNDAALGPMEKYYSILGKAVNSIAVDLPGFAYHNSLKARKTLVNLMRPIVEKRRATGIDNQQKCMVDLLMEVQDDDGKQLLDDQEIVDLLLVFLFAGHESTAHAAMGAMVYLQKHPEVLQKAKEEQEEIIKRRPFTQKGLSMKEIKQMEYLAKVVDELLRIINIFFCQFRMAKTDVNVNGYLIPKGWKVLVWNRAIHMDPNIYSNPKEFNPSRWNNYVAKPGVFIPFGTGSRICPGADFAKLEMFVFLHYFLLNYKLEQLNPDCSFVYLPIPGLADNCLAKITKLT